MPSLEVLSFLLQFLLVNLVLALSLYLPDLLLFLASRQTGDSRYWNLSELRVYGPWIAALNGGCLLAYASAVFWCPWSYLQFASPWLAIVGLLYLVFRRLPRLVRQMTEVGQALDAGPIGNS